MSGAGTAAVWLERHQVPCSFGAVAAGLSVGLLAPATAPGLGAAVNRVRPGTEA